MKYLIANWKMNPGSLEDALSLAKGVEVGLAGIENLETVLCPPFPYIHPVGQKLNYSSLGAQDVSGFDAGAYTGQVSALQLADLGVKYCIVGHSERRKYAHETDDEVARKVKMCVEAGIVPVVCLGAGFKPNDSEAKIKSLLRSQFEHFLHGTAFKKVLVTYEPTWAISSEHSGQMPDGKHVAEIADFLRHLVHEEHIENFATLYGGSVNSYDVQNYESVDGFLVGHASLSAEEFIRLAHRIHSD